MSDEMHQFKKNSFPNFNQLPAAKKIQNGASQIFGPSYFDRV